MESESSPSPPPEMNLDFDIPSPRTYLARLRESLEKSRSYTSSKPKHRPTGLHGRSRKRNHTSPVPLVAPGLPSSNRLRLSDVLGGGEDSEGSESDVSSLSSSTSSISVDIKTRNAIGGASVREKRAASQSPSHHYRFSPASKGILGGRVTAWDHDVHLPTNVTTPLSRQHPSHSSHTGLPLLGIGGREGNDDIMSSLQTINGQLGELLSRVGHQPLNSTVVPHPQSRYTPSPAPFVPGDAETSAFQTSSFLNTSGQ